jgi:putative ABC transport system permease protein
MRNEAVMALRSLGRAPKRSAALVAVLAASMLALTLIKASYADMFERVREEQVAEKGDLWLEAKAGRGLDLAGYKKLNSLLVAEGRASRIRAAVSVQGLVGDEISSAPASGIAEEGSFEDWKSADGTVPAELGAALARSLKVGPGSEFQALIGDAGFSLKVKAVVTTEADERDRFYIGMPFEALAERGLVGRVETIGLWLPKPRESTVELSRYLASLPELEGYESFSFEQGGTRANGIVNVYDQNYRVVIAAVGLAMLLSLSNILLLSVWERGEEWGTLLALGTPLRSLRVLVLLEGLVVAVLATLAGTVLSLGIAGIVNLLGGLTFPPPPTSTAPLHLYMKPGFSSYLLAAAMAAGSALVASLLAGRGIGRKRIIELLCERN